MTQLAARGGATTHGLEHWIQTFKGHCIDPLQPTHDKIDIDDIAHALSNLCRFAGHVTSFYSVAQHSVHVSELMSSWGCSPRVQLLGLLHDASEAYLVDLPSPIKHRMPEYKKHEDRLTQVIMEALRVYPLPHLEKAWGVVKRADIIMLGVEARDLHDDPQDWPVLQGLELPAWKVHPLMPTDAKASFRIRYQQLMQAVKLEGA